LSANAVEATDDDFRVTMTVHRHFAEIAVEDRDSRPARLISAGPDELRGRGLAIVDALSSRWGQEPCHTSGKRVWSEVSLPVGSALTQDCRL
jgi:hypothetical protein